MKQSTFKRINKATSIAIGALSSGSAMGVGNIVELTAEERYRQSHPSPYIGRPGFFGGIVWRDSSTNKRVKVKPEYKIGHGLINGTTDSKGIYYEVVDHGFDTTRDKIKLITKIGAVALGATIQRLAEDGLNKSEWYKHFSDSKERSADVNAVDDNVEDDEESLNNWAEEL